jgi:hypothetical protein
VTVIPNSALSRPAYKPARPSRSTIRLMACRVLVSAFLDSTWALVERVIKGYLPLRLSFAIPVWLLRCHGRAYLTSTPLTTVLLPRLPARARHCRSAARRWPGRLEIPKAHSVPEPAVEWQKGGGLREWVLRSCRTCWRWWKGVCGIDWVECGGDECNDDLTRRYLTLDYSTVAKRLCK